MDKVVAVASRSFSRHPILRKELCEKYSNVKFNDEGIVFNEESLTSFLEGATHAITALEKITAKVIQQCPDLRVLSKYGVGTDMIDFKTLMSHDIKFGWKAGVNCLSVAELTLASMIQLLHRVPECVDEVKRGIWRQSFGRQLSGKVVGIIGCGHVGRKCIELLQPFGCRVLVYDIARYPDFYARYGVMARSLEELLKEADVVTVHTPLDDSTRCMLSYKELDWMKNDAILINYARGGIVHEGSLLMALEKGKFSGIALDVLEIEPPVTIEMNRFPRVLLTPHIGGSTEEAVLAMGRAAIEGLSTATSLK